MVDAKLYKNPWTLDGRLKMKPGVTEAKLKAAQLLVEQALNGDRQAKGRIEEALISTSDFVLNLAHLINATVLPKLDQVELVSDRLVGRRPVTDFRDNYLYTLDQQWNAGVVGDGQVDEPLDALPTVPEATPYPEAYFKGELIEGSHVRKTGLRTGITWEAIINDSTGIISQFPGAFQSLATNTIEKDAFRTLINGVGVNQALKAGTALDGTEVVADAPLSRAALDVAITQAQVEYKDQYRGTMSGGFYLVVGIGKSRFANWIINNLSLESIKDANLVWGVSGNNPLAGIEPVESIYVEGNAWYLVPKPGSTPRPVLDRLSLIGHEAAELRVNNLTGTYVGGSTVPPFEGSFDADTADWRVRLVVGHVLWSPYAVVWSDGEGA